MAPEFVGPFRNGGVGTACYWQAVVLAQAGHDVTVLYTGQTMSADAATWAQRFQAELGIRYVDLARWAEANNRATPNLLPEAEPLFIAEQVLAFAREARFAVVYVQEFLGQGLRVLQAACSDRLGYRPVTVATLHSPMDWIYEGMHMVPRHEGELDRDFMEKETARLCDRLVAPSRHMADWVRTRWGFTREVDVLFNCFDPSGVSGETDENERTFSGLNHLVFFGRLETRKGLHLFLEALADSEPLQQRAPRITFLGRPSDLNGRDAAEVIAESLAPLPYEWQILGDKDAHQAWAWLQAQEGILVVAPSIQDNLPYTLVELYTRNLPFVSTRVGGIPEIVGPNNAHLLCAPEAEDLRRVLERILKDGTVTVRYEGGYHTPQAHVRFLEFHNSLRPSPEQAASNAASNPSACTQIMEQEPEVLAEMLQTSTDDWVLLQDTALTLDPQAVETLIEAATASGLAGATAYVRVTHPKGATPHTIAPLGPGVEAGWFEHALCGPLLLLKRTRLVEALGPDVAQMQSLWELALAAALHGLRWIVLPEVCASVEASALNRSPEALNEQRLRLCEWLGRSENGPPAAFPDWLLSFLAARAQLTAAGGGSGGEGLYRQLASVSEEDLQDFLFPPTAEPGQGSMDGPGGLNATFGRACRRLEAALSEPGQGEGRLYIYGAGEHSRALLGAQPELLKRVTAFVDQRGAGDFLGRPIVAPEDLHLTPDDRVIYSSIEREREMRKRLATADGHHVLLYTDEGFEADS